LVLAGIQAAGSSAALADFGPFLILGGLVSLVLAIWQPFSDRWLTWTTFGLSLVGMVLLNLAHEPVRFPLVDWLMESSVGPSRFLGMPMPLFLLRNTPWVLYALGALAALFACPLGTRSSPGQRITALGGLGLVMLAMLGPSGVHFHAHTAPTTVDSAALVPTMVSGEVTQRRWIRVNSERPQLLVTMNKIASDLALTDIAQGIEQTALDDALSQGEISSATHGRTRVLLGAMWGVDRVVSVAVVFGRVLLLPVFVVIVWASWFRGGRRMQRVVEGCRKTMGLVLLLPVLINLPLMLVVLATGVAGPASVFTALAWQGYWTVLVMGCWWAGALLSNLDGRA